MTNPNEIIDYIRLFLEFCLNHPYVSVPVAFILMLGLAAHFFETVKKFVEFIFGIQRNGTRTQKALMWTGFASILALSIASPYIAERFARPKPIIQTKPGKVLAKDFVVTWDYKTEASQTVSFEVLISDRSAAGKNYSYPSKTPYFKVRERGKLGIQVRAIGSNWHSAYSDAIDVEVYDNSVDRIRAKREMVVAVHQDNSDGLFCFLDPETGDYDGFDIDLIKLIAEKLQIRYGLTELNVVKSFVKWPEIIEEPNKYDVDFSISSISINDERQKTVLFSKPYWETEIALMQRADWVKGQGALVTLRDLKDLKIGVHKGTTAVDFLNRIKEKAPTIEIKPLDNNADLFGWLENETISALAYDYARTLAERANHPNLVSRKFDRGEFHVDTEYYGIAFAMLNQKLRQDINQILANEKATIFKIMTDRMKGLQRRIALAAPA